MTGTHSKEPVHGKAQNCVRLHISTTEKKIKTLGDKLYRPSLFLQLERKPIQITPRPYYRHSQARSSDIPPEETGHTPNSASNRPKTYGPQARLNNAGNNRQNIPARSRPCHAVRKTQGSWRGRQRQGKTTLCLRNF